MDTLEKFIQENREKFDNQQPDQGIWLAIDRQMNEESKSLWQRFYSLGIAASVVLILSAGIVIGLFINQDRSPDFYTEVESSLTLHRSSAWLQRVFSQARYRRPT